MKTASLILIGFMGSGKSSIGKQLARHFQHDHLDIDDLITRKTGKSISTIFELEGETRFRELETEVLNELALLKKNFILSTGGGIVLSEKNRLLLKTLGRVIWLQATPEALFERAMRQSHRPLLNVEYPRRTFQQLLEKRLSLYQEACDIKIDTTHFSYSKTVDSILELVEK